MKTVFSPSELAHVWANQLQSEGRTAGNNFYFRNNEIFSYGSHFKIAKHVQNEQGQPATLMTTRGYSVSTAKHIRHVEASISHLNVIYCKHPAVYEHRENILAWEEKARQSAEKLKRANKPEIYLTQIAREKEEMQRYADFFRLVLSEYHLNFIYITTKDGGKEANEKQEEINRLAKIAKEKADKLRYAKELKEFRKFDRTSVAGDMAYLRYNAEQKRIETSKGVQIPQETARRFFQWMIKTLKAGGCTTCEAKILDYTVNEVNSKTFVIGCHTIEQKEAKKIAKLLNWI